MIKKRGFSLVAVLLIYAFLIGFVSAEKLEVEIGNEYSPGENIDFKIVLYDNNTNKIEGKIDFVVQDYYTDEIHKGSINSDEAVSFKLPEDAIKGYWAIIAKYEGVEKKELFNVMELEKADISLEGSELIIKNIGNTPYQKSIQISIGDYHETALVPLDVGETKRIRLTAPEGEYMVRVSDGTNDNTHEFSRVGLTGKVVGLEDASGGNFLTQYPIVSLFLVAILFVVIFTVIVKLRKSVNNNVCEDVLC